MEKKEKKIFKHPFYDKHTILGSIVLAILGTLIAQAVVGSLFILVYTFITGDRDPGSTGYNAAMYIGVIIGSFIVLAIFKRWFYPEYEGGFKGGQNVPRWCIPSVAIPVLLLLYLLITSPETVGVPPVVNIFAAFFAGIGEETIYRGLVTSYLMRQWGEQKKPLIIVFASSLMFGLVHMTNVLAGAPLAMTAFQVLGAFCLGCFMCTVYLRSGSLIPPMIFHILYDIVAFTDVEKIGEGGTFRPEAAFVLEEKILEIVLDVIFIALTIYLTRPAVQGQIKEMWDKKWNRVKKEALPDSPAEPAE